MIKRGRCRRPAKYWGGYEVKDFVTLDSPVKCFSTEKGQVDFNPTIVKLAWDREPSEDKHDLWFPYWITIDGKEKYGQFAPMIGQKALLELLLKAIDQDFFENDFLEGLARKIDEHMKNRKHYKKMP